LAASKYQVAATITYQGVSRIFVVEEATFKLEVPILLLLAAYRKWRFWLYCSLQHIEDGV